MLNFLPRVMLIEPNIDLAETVSDVLTEEGFAVDIVATHVGAAQAADQQCPQLLIACVPACAEDRPGAYLGAWREALGQLPTVLLLCDGHEDHHGPAGAVCLVKPFTRAELLLAVDIALMSAEDPPPPHGKGHRYVSSLTQRP